MPVPACHIRLPHFAAAIKCHDLVSGIGYSTVPYFSQLGRFWYSSLTPSMLSRKKILTNQNEVILRNEEVQRVNKEPNSLV